MLHRLRRPLRRGVSPRPAREPGHSSARPAGPGNLALAKRSRVWLLDLDNTLHDSRPALLPRIDRDMTGYMMARLGLSEAEAGALRRHYWQRYGATLLGLVRHHGVDPADFLRATHRFPDMASLVRRNVRLRRALAQLPGRRVLVTNAPHHYARQVIGSLGVAPLIEAIVSIETMRVAGRIRPKPSVLLMRQIVARLRTHASRCVMVEDTLANLVSARSAGLSTVLVRSKGPDAFRDARGPRRHAGRSRIVDLQVQSFESIVRSPVRVRL
jgi:putative hydrolase of the HAD superfamily